MGGIWCISAFAWRNPRKTCQGRPFCRSWFEPVISEIHARWRCGVRRLAGYCNRFLGCHARSPSCGLLKPEIISIHVPHFKRVGLSPWHTKYCGLKRAKVASAWSVHTNSMFLRNIYKSMFVKLHLLKQLYFKMSCVYCCSCLVCIVVCCLVYIVVAVLYVVLLFVLYVLL